MYCFIPGLHYTEVTRDRICLVYALMKDVPISIGAVLKSAMRKARVHRGRRYHKDKGAGEYAWTHLTTAERNRRDDLITERMFGLEMLRHKNGCHASTEEQLDEIAYRYPLNEHAESLLGLEPAFLEPIWDDVRTDEDK
ncbi:hypothetical protein H5410_022745 [Solanum commersonii]|uniref:Uncharacterized protein n=1 Tax=Solanum commersonii TaxID=4109 RepID=A0A9J5ZI18_SOLCO|nr:hypothetical protein H5410_022745 [Solanum commersonii]